jgi:hypothetical protein
MMCCGILLLTLFVVGIMFIVVRMYDMEEFLTLRMN